jgi:glyoxylase-like metal-dependent hydrolase (beta-lactamase superfamily II)
MNDDLIIEILELGPFFVNCYIVGDAETKEGFIIDPGYDPERIISFVEGLGLKIGTIAITHGHADHIAALDEIRRHFGARVLIGEKDAPMLGDPEANLSEFAGERFVTGGADRLLKEGDTVAAGKYTFKVLETPGHSPGSISLYGHGAVFTGDALFLGSIGRTDFPGSSYETLIESIHEKLLTLPDDTIVYSGHGTDTTIGQERDFNPFLL